MELFDISNKDELTINEKPLFLTGTTKNLKLTVSPNVNASIVLSQVAINSLEICVLESATLNIDFIGHGIIDIKENFSLGKNAMVNFKVIYDI